MDDDGIKLIESGMKDIHIGLNKNLIELAAHRGGEGAMGGGG